ncbi:MAG: glycosyltransferase family 2 protein [Chloroflexi bacterium]|nr:glycosyltransferase family 2 protein [Chloroflexota bacterium]
MANDKIDLSIVIVSYNVRELLARCLKSVDSGQWTVDSRNLIADHCPLSTEIFVVDNASCDGSTVMVREKFPSVHLIENAENRGFAAGNNQAFPLTRGRYVLMLNPDTEVRAGALETLVRFMDAHPRAGACGGKLLYGDGAFQHSAFAFPTLAQIFLDFFPLNWRLIESRLNGRYPRAWYARGAPFPIDHPLGADFLVRREVAEQVGWLDDRFFIYCEEIDWAMRIKRAGWQIWCVPQAEIVHHEAKSTSQFREAMFIELWRARARLFRKHYARAFRFAAQWIVRVGLWNEARKACAAARRGEVTQEELARRLDAYGQVWHNVTG